ncbi:glycoside hydrolase family 18 protein [Trametes coccinea BRFM310]|uniref:Glycoside hydrolase family 18 protein n=1 Tax=Trametes coccinea (strain BRFM310) TaxID=1353009 RepID=A0A1Y2IC20_TRAC3|nr:glycoside hydrolase family 18 protein [Trametes coccinea BRFM310]
MTIITAASVVSHTTASAPRPHILYNVEVKTSDGKTAIISKRYSDFVALHDTLNDPGSLPPKRILSTTFVPSAWLDDTLIAERKAGLSAYLTGLLQSPQFRVHKVFIEFLTPSGSATTSRDFNPEDALPSTLSRKAALEVQSKLSAEAVPIYAAYYPDWSSGQIPPNTLDFSKFDIILFAFATPNSSSTISFDSGSTSTLKTLVSSAHNSGHGTKVVLSIGGWGGSYWFSQTMSSAANRSTFVNACVSAVNTYKLDGIDIDWEYPGESGAGNPHSTADSANLLSFFQSLRSALGSSKIISAAVTQLPWVGSNGQPLTNVSAYAAQMTYANIMNYDVFGASSSPGPNAPLGNLCGNSVLPQYSAQAALQQWTAAGFPASKLVLGLPLYGYVSQSTKTTLQHIARPPPGFKLEEYKEKVLGLPERGLACPLPQEQEVQEETNGTDNGEPNMLAPTGNHGRSKAQEKAKTKEGVRAEASGDLSSYFGQQIPFNQIVALGALTKTSSGTYVSANGYTEGWDNCSDTPYLFNTSRKTVVTYDDTYSLGDKATFAKQNGMAGCFTWSLDQDDGYTLTNVIRSSLGK